MLFFVISKTALQNSGKSNAKKPMSLIWHYRITRGELHFERLGKGFYQLKMRFLFSVGIFAGNIPTEG
jgi:hypothetical protein